MSNQRSLGIMQPYFFPYWGHFALIAQTQRWVIFDITQYTPKTWMNRNRILHPSQGWQYVTAPVQNASISMKTCDMQLVDRQICGEQLLRQLMHYKKKAPFYAQVCEVVRTGFSRAKDHSLVALNVACLQACCDYLELDWQYEICSKMNLLFPQEMQAGDWAPMIASQVGAAVYVNPIGGRSLFNPQKFEELGISLQFLQTHPWSYPTRGYAYEEALSIIDVMMWVDPNEIKNNLFTHSHLIT